MTMFGYSNDTTREISRYSRGASITLAAAVFLLGCSGGADAVGGAESYSPPDSSGNGSICDTLEIETKTASVVLEGKEGFWEKIAGDADDLFWSSKDLASADLLHASRAGGEIESIGNWSAIHGIELERDHVFVRTDDALIDVSRPDNVVKKLADLPDPGFANRVLATDETFAYSVGSEHFDPDCEDAEGEVYAIDKRTGVKKVLTSGQACAEEIHVADELVYFIERGKKAADGGHRDAAIKRVSRSGGDAKVVARGWLGESMTILDGSVYFSLSHSDSVGSGETLARVPSSGGAIETLSDDCEFVTDLASSANGVIYTGRNYSFLTLARDSQQLRAIRLAPASFRNAFTVIGDEILQTDASSPKIWSVSLR